MVFDWFRRKFDQSTPKADSQPETASSPNAPGASSESGQPEVTESAPEVTPEPTSESTASESTPEDEYLAWAKAAYQNLKKQQVADVEPAPEPIAPDLKAEFPEPIAPTPDEPLDSSSQASDRQDQDSQDQERQDKESEDRDSQEIADRSLSPALAAVVEPENLEKPAPEIPTPEQARSLLDRGAADRQARLEQLKAEALAAEPDPTPAPAQAEAKSTMVFDEDFIWSAEVLAKEGRQPDQVSVEEITWLSRLRQGLDKTRRGVINQLKATIGRGPLDEDAVLTLESLLLQSDVGVKATDYIIEALQRKLRQESLPPEQAIAYLKEIVRTLLDRPLAAQGNPVLAPEHDRLNIWLVTGVNGAGKTTTIGKLAHLAQKSGYRCLIAAADTFRAAAVQQVQVWGERTGVEVIANPGKNTDPAAVVFDALTAAQSRNTELLLIDTAGRLQNKKNLMAELSKIRKTIDKKADHAIVESLLVLDATLGQNGLRQAEVFGEAANLTGVVLTKLDGTAKGGVALGVVEQLNLPIRFVGAGEKITDLRPFSSYEFVEALLNG